MLFIRGKNLYIEHPNKTSDILKNLNFHINQNSKIGLIGENGSGKTTFLNTLQSNYKSFKGDLIQNFQKENSIYTIVQEIKENDVTLENYLWLGHNLYELRNNIYNSSDNNISSNLEKYQDLGGYEFELLIDKLLKDFNFFEDDLLRKISDFSGGEKTKISIIKSILYDPEFLLFDEPANNLDFESIEWFKNYLKNINKPFIIVSHERDLLDSCVDSIWEIENNTLKVYTGNYSTYIEQKKNYLENILINNQSIDHKISKLSESINDRRQKAQSFENFKAKRSIKKNGGICKRDDGTGSGSLSVKKMMKGALALETRKKKLLSEKVVIKKEKNIKIIFDSESIKTKYILDIKDLSINFHNHSLKGVNLNLFVGDKINIYGKNGLGKSSFLKILIGINNNFSGNFYWNPQTKISYFSQNHDNLDFNKTLLSEVSIDTNKSESEIRRVLAYLNLTEKKIYNRISELSLGERAKVIIAKIILSDSNVLVLDEPTNYLDIKSREALEKALLLFKGVIIFVSHDKFLVEKIANRYLNLEDYIA